MHGQKTSNKTSEIIEHQTQKYLASVQAFVAVQMRSPFFFDVTQRWSLVTDVSVPPSMVMQSTKDLTAWLLKMGPIICPETSVTNDQLTKRNIPDEQRCQKMLSFFVS